MTVKSLTFDWFQCGSIQDTDGAGENWSKYTVGTDGILSIEENEPHNGLEKWNYLVTHEDGRVFRVFNPNFIEYFPNV